MKLSAEGLAHLKNEEGCRLRAYQDTVGVWTIGYGHTGPDVYPGLTWTQEMAERALARRLESEFEAAVNKGVRVPLKQHQYDALVSFTYNVGAAAFLRSTMLHKINDGDFAGATAEFDKWVIPSEITGRRMREKAMFAGRAADNDAPRYAPLKTIDVQRVLKEQGYYSGDIDGILGPKTHSAIKAYQADKGLVVDGIVGPKTLESMQRAVVHPSIFQKIKMLLAA